MARITPKASRHVSKKLGEIGTSIKKALTKPTSNNQGPKKAQGGRGNRVIDRVKKGGKVKELTAGQKLDALFKGKVPPPSKKKTKTRKPLSRLKEGVQNVKKGVRNVQGRVEKIAAPKKEDLAKGQAKIQPATRGQAVTRNVEKEGIGKGRVGGVVVTSLTAGAIEIARQLLDSDTPFTAHSDANQGPKKAQGGRGKVKELTTGQKLDALISDGRVNPADFPTYKKDTKSATSFRNAFKNAVDKGDKTFKWEDRTYNTKKAVDLARRVQTARKGKPPVPKKARGGLVKKSKFLFGLKK